MNASNELIQYLWLGFNFLFGALQILAAALMFEKRLIASWMMMVGSILSGIFVVGTHLLFVLQLKGFLSWSTDSIPSRVNMLSSVAAFGGLLFIMGLILYALRRRALSARIVELEQILTIHKSGQP